MAIESSLRNISQNTVSLFIRKRHCLVNHHHQYPWRKYIPIQFYSMFNAVLFQFYSVLSYFSFVWLSISFFTSGDYICSLLGIFSDAFFFILASIVLSVNIGGWLQLNHFSTTLYCPLAIIKKLLQLILHFHWLRRSPLQRIDIFWYSPSSRKMVALFVNISKRE